MHENGDATTLDTEAAREALEKFVMENDELLELEARIGRFNIFDALGIVNAEIRHSNFLGWLLDPAESHGAGDLFLKAVLMDMLRQTDDHLRPKGVSPIDLDGAAITSVDIRREWKNIDLLIRCESPRLVIAIENKIRSGEHGGQLLKYKKIVREAFPDDPSMFVFLTREGDEPSDEDWTTYSYARLKSVLERVRMTNEGAIGEDVDTFLDHYLHLIGSRLMDDEVIDDLCRKIYKNHRQAIDLIVDRVVGVDDRMQIIEETVLSDSLGYDSLGNTGSGFHFVPKSWRNVLPTISRYSTWPDAWLVCNLYFHNDNLIFRLWLWDTTEAPPRERLLDNLLANADKLQLVLAKGRTKTSTTLCKEQLGNWPRYEFDAGSLRAAVNRKLTQSTQRFDDIQAVMQQTSQDIE